MSTAQLTHLNGFGEESDDENEPPKAYALTDRDGEVHPFNAESKLYLVDDQGKRKGGVFKTLLLEDKELTGELLDGSELTANLDTLDRIELDVKDTATPVAVGVSLGIALIAFIVVGAMAMNGLP